MNFNNVYIAGPISGRAFYTEVVPHFKAAERKCKYHFGNNKGIYNPVDHKAPPGEYTEEFLWQYFMREGIKALMECDTIYLLKGWHRSKGAIIEKKIADELGYAVFYEEDYDV